MTRPVGELARDLYWDYRIKPKDAVHVATAAFYKITVLNTFYDGLLGKSGLIVNGHQITIAKPYSPEQLQLAPLVQEKPDENDKPTGE